MAQHYAVIRFLLILVYLLKTTLPSSCQVQVCSVCHFSDSLLSDCLSAFQIQMNSIVTSSSNHCFLLTSYSTSNIQHYSLLSYAINHAFAVTHNYSILATSPNTGHEFEHRDQRWNKVGIIHQFLKSQRPLSSYYVWLDSDLIITQFNFSLQNITMHYSWAHIIICADSSRENGIANTGSMIVKNSPWSKSFFDRWWNAFDRSDGMDQHVFDILWVKNEMDMQSHVAILPAEAFNSRFPAYLHHQDSHPALHLAGESSLVREVIFKAAFESICSSHMPLQSLRGVDANHLRRFFVEDIPLLLRRECIRIQQEMQLAGNESTQNAFSDLKMWKERLQDLAQSARNDDTFRDCQLECFRMIFNTQQSLIQLDKGVSLALIQQFLDGAMELAVAERQTDLIQRPVLIVLPYLTRLLQSPSLIHSSSFSVLLYYKYKALEFLLNLEFLDARLLEPDANGGNYFANIEEQVLEAYVVWRNMSSLGYYGAGNAVSEPFTEIAQLLRRAAAMKLRVGQGEKAIDVLLEGLFLLLDPWLHRDRSIADRQQLWNRLAPIVETSNGFIFGIRLGLVQHLENESMLSLVFDWTSIPFGTAVAILIQIGGVMISASQLERGALYSNISSVLRLPEWSCAMLTALRRTERPWIFEDSPLIRMDKDSMSFGYFSMDFKSLCLSDDGETKDGEIERKNNFSKKKKIKKFRRSKEGNIDTLYIEHVLDFQQFGIF